MPKKKNEYIQEKQDKHETRQQPFVPYSVPAILAKIPKPDFGTHACLHANAIRYDRKS